MAITNYSTLQTAIAEYANNPEVEQAIPTFIQLAETQMNRDIRHWRQQRRVTTTVDEQFEDLPTDFLEAIHFYIDTTNGEKTLEFASMAEISRRKISQAGIANEPVVYTFNSGQIEFVPAPDDSYPLTMVYYAKTEALSTTDTTNWILTNHPDVYLYASLLQLAPYLAEDARAAVWKTMYEEAVLKINAESESAIYSGSPLVMRNK